MFVFVFKTYIISKFDNVTNKYLNQKRPTKTIRSREMAKKIIKEEIPSKSQKSTQSPRQYKGQVEVDHDLFRLEVSNTKKNISFRSDSAIWENVPHKHMFHTVDSDGKPQHNTCPTASHYHKVTIKEVDGKFVAQCSEPYQMKVVKGKRVEVPYQNDSHTHEVTYLRSERIMQRVYSQDALNAINSIKNYESNKLKNPAI